MYQSHTGRLTGLWFLPKPAFGLNTNDDIYITKNYTRTLQCQIKFSISFALQRPQFWHVRKQVALWTCQSPISVIPLRPSVHTHYKVTAWWRHVPLLVQIPIKQWTLPETLRQAIRCLFIKNEEYLISLPKPVPHRLRSRVSSFNL